METYSSKDAETQAFAPDGADGTDIDGIAGADAPAADIDAAIDFLQHWEPNGPWVLTAIIPDGNTETRTFMPGQEADVTGWIAATSGQRNFYFSVNRPKHPLTKKAEKADIGWIAAVHVDIDLSGARDAEEEARILARLRENEPPTAIVFSGGGYQAFWRLTEPMPATDDNVSNIEDLNRKIAARLGGDHCHNIDRIMRLPGTVNVPNEKKRAKGRVPELAHIAEVDWDRKYPIGVALAYPSLDRLPDWCRVAIETGETDSSGGDRSRAVFAVACELVRAGWSDGDICAVLLDPSIAISAHVLAQRRPEKYVARQCRRAREVAAEDYRRIDGKIVRDDQANIRKALANLGAKVSHDIFADRLLIEGLDGEPSRYLDDTEMSALRLSVDERCGFRPTKEFFYDVVVNEARQNAFHPIRDYLAGVTCDEVARLDNWLVIYAGAEDTEYVRAVGRLWLVAAVRRIRQPGCKFDEMLVLETPTQGQDKSSALADLAVCEDWFTDSLALNSRDKELIETLSGHWIVEAPELSKMRQGDIETLKAQLSRQSDRARLAYGRLPVTKPRQCVFVGTTNSEKYLRDPTGNRRFWPVRIDHFDRPALRRDRDQLWAEAAAAEAAGESIRLDPRLYPVAAEEQERRQIEDDPWIDLIGRTLGERKGRIEAEGIWQIVGVPRERRTQHENVRIGAAMRRLEWVSIGPQRHHGGRPTTYASGSERERGRWLKVNLDGRCVYEIDTVERAFAAEMSRKGFRLVSNDEDPEAADVAF